MSIVTVIHVIVSILLIAVVLLQQGKGADVGATFGGGGQSMFGAAGADNLLTRVTTIIAAFFMITSVTLAVRTKESLSSDGELFKDVAPVAETVEQTAPPAVAQEEAATSEAGKNLNETVETVSAEAAEQKPAEPAESEPSDQEAPQPLPAE